MSDNKKLRQRIQKLKAKLAKTEAKLNESEEFKWEYESYNACYLGSLFIEDNFLGQDKDYLYHGRYRKTKANAEKALERNRLANRLEALAEQLDSDWVADWDDPEQYKYYIVFSHDSQNYKTFARGLLEGIGQVYMSEETAIKICNMLNSKEIKL
jgi:hypothetical protein